jgi:hypothetical protein
MLRVRPLTKTVRDTGDVERDGERSLDLDLDLERDAERMRMSASLPLSIGRRWSEANSSGQHPSASSHDVSPDNNLTFNLTPCRPTVSVDKDDLYERLERVYSESLGVVSGPLPIVCSSDRRI